MGMRRHAGRPDTKMSEELDRLILQTASQLFAEQGYAATSMEQIAASAQVGKQTIYRRHASKEALFMTVMTDLGQSFLSAAAPAAATVSADPLLALRQTMRRLLDLVLSPPTIALSRTFVAEGWRFPDLVEHAGVHIFDPLERLTHDLLVAVEAAGLLNGAYDLVETSRALSALLLGGPHQHVLFGRNAFATKAARDHYLDQSWAMFMTGILSRTAATRQDVHA